MEIVQVITPEDIEQAKQRNNNAYRRINAYLQLEARKISPRDLDYSHEIAQQSLIKLFGGSINTYNSKKGAPDTWLRKIIHNIHKDNQKKRQEEKNIPRVQTFLEKILAMKHC